MINTIDLNFMKKGICCKRGISTKWMLKNTRQEDKKNVFWERRSSFIDFIEDLKR